MLTIYILQVLLELFDLFLIFPHTPYSSSLSTHRQMVVSAAVVKHLLLVSYPVTSVVCPCVVFLRTNIRLLPVLQDHYLPACPPACCLPALQPTNHLLPLASPRHPPPFIHPAPRRSCNSSPPVLPAASAHFIPSAVPATLPVNHLNPFCFRVCVQVHLANACDFPFKGCNRITSHSL